jgi:hypothetical protein
VTRPDSCVVSSATFSSTMWGEARAVASTLFAKRRAPARLWSSSLGQPALSAIRPADYLQQYRLRTPSQTPEMPDASPNQQISLHRGTRSFDNLGPLYEPSMWIIPYPLDIMRCICLGGFPPDPVVAHGHCGESVQERAQRVGLPRGRAALGIGHALEHSAHQDADDLH